MKPTPPLDVEAIRALVASDPNHYRNREDFGDDGFYTAIGAVNILLAALDAEKQARQESDRRRASMFDRLLLAQSAFELSEKARQQAKAKFDVTIEQLRASIARELSAIKDAQSAEDRLLVEREARQQAERERDKACLGYARVTHQIDDMRLAKAGWESKAFAAEQALAEARARIASLTTPSQ